MERERERQGNREDRKKGVGEKGRKLRRKEKDRRNEGREKIGKKDKVTL